MKPIESLSQVYASVIRLAERFTGMRYWRTKLVMVLTCLSLTFSSGNYLKLNRSLTQDINWIAFEQKKEHPFTQLDFPPRSHPAKTTFRLTVPLIARLFHLSNLAVFLLQFLAGMLFLYFSIYLVEKITGDSITALLTTAGFTFIYTGSAGFTDTNAWFDAFAYLFLLLAMLSPNAILILLWTQLAAWTDERAAIACLLVFIWWKVCERKIQGFTPSSIFRLGLKSSAVLLSLIIYLLGRFLLSKYANVFISEEGVGFDMILNSFNCVGMALWSSLEGFWVLIIACVLFLMSYKKIFLPFSIIGMMAVIMLVAFSVFDITRSAAYMFPVIFISQKVLFEKFKVDDLRRILIVCAFISFLFPSYFYASRDYKILWNKPVFIRIIEKATIQIDSSGQTNNDKL